MQTKQTISRSLNKTYHAQEHDSGCREHTWWFYRRNWRRVARTFSIEEKAIEAKHILVVMVLRSVSAGNVGLWLWLMHTLASPLVTPFLASAVRSSSTVTRPESSASSCAYEHRQWSSAELLSAWAAPLGSSVFERLTSAKILTRSESLAGFTMSELSARFDQMQSRILRSTVGCGADEMAKYESLGEDGLDKCLA